MFDLARAFEHRVQKDIRATRDVLGQCIFGFVVAQAVDARDEDHRSRTVPRQVNRVVSRAADDALMRIVERLDRARDGRDATVIEGRRGADPVARDLDRQPALLSRSPRSARATRLPSRRYAHRRDDADRR